MIPTTENTIQTDFTAVVWRVKKTDDKIVLEK